jgi:hypothetical protein
MANLVRKSKFSSRLLKSATLTHCGSNVAPLLEQAAGRDLGEKLWNEMHLEFENMKEIHGHK